MAGGAGAGADGGAGGGGGGDGDGRGPSGGSGRNLREMDEERLLDPGLKVCGGLWSCALKNQQMEGLSD